MGKIVRAVVGGVGTIVKPLANVLGLGGHGAPAPEPPPTVMPTADDAAVQAAKRRALAKNLARGGRGSTILSDNSGSDTLGG